MIWILSIYEYAARPKDLSSLPAGRSGSSQLPVVTDPRNLIVLWIPMYMCHTLTQKHTISINKIKYFFKRLTGVVNYFVCPSKKTFSEFKT